MTKSWTYGNPIYLYHYFWALLQPEPVLQIEDIQTNNERGLLGIAYNDVKIYLFVTENGA